MSNMSFHPEQISSANNIFRVFTIGVIRYALLMAFCQSGKSGAFHWLIKKMLNAGRIQRAYILCGSTETELRDQAKSDAAKLNSEFYKEDNTGQIQIYFRQDFEKARLDTTNALIIVDESHLVQGQKQTLCKFLGRYGITMDGNPAPLMEKNTYFLSVDATPYSELSAITHKESHMKHIEKLIPGKGYYGIENYMYDGRLKETFNISSDPARFQQLLVALCTKKYALMRFTKGKKSAANETAVKNICKARGFNVRYFTQECKDITIASLETAPSVTTVVIFRGCLRAGKVVPKKHTGLVWEGSDKSKTDALAQGLPGRMCGYEGMFGDAKPMCFVPPSSLKENEKGVIKASEMRRVILEHPIAQPLKATNLKKAHVAPATVNGTIECPPLRLNWDGDDDDWSFRDKFETEYRDKPEWRLRIGRWCLDLLSKNLDLIRNNSNYSDEQKKEILDQIMNIDLATAHSFGLRHLQGHSQTNWFKKLRMAQETNTATGELIDECRPLNFVVTYGGYKGAHSNPRHLYVIFYTEATGGGGGIMAANLESRIARTNGKSVFSFNTAATNEPVVAAGAYCLFAEDIKDQESLYAALYRYLILARTDSHFTKSISCNKDAFRLSIKAFPNDKKDVQRICSRLGTEFGIKMSVKYKQGRTTEGFFNLKEISW
jgi:hypothetical protein